MPFLFQIHQQQQQQHYIYETLQHISNIHTSNIFLFRWFLYACWCLDTHWTEYKKIHIFIYLNLCSFQYNLLACRIFYVIFLNKIKTDVKKKFINCSMALLLLLLHTTRKYRIIIFLFSPMPFCFSVILDSHYAFIHNVCTHLW